MPSDVTLPVKLFVSENSPPSCLWCGAPLPRSRSDRRFCSRACIVRFAKWRKGVMRLQNQITHRLKLLAEYAHYPQFVDAPLALSEISKQLGYYTQLADKRQQKALTRLDGDGQ